MKIFNKQNEKGAIAILTLMGVSVFALFVMTSVNVLAADELKMSASEKDSEMTFYAAEAGLNEALYRLILNPVPEPFSFDINGVNIQVSVSSNPANHYQRIIQSKAEDATGKIRTLEVIANTSSYSGGFDYAVQSGSGGIFLDNNSWITGKVYSNADIIGGNNTRVIATAQTAGDVWLAGNNKIDSLTIDGDAHVYNIIDSEIAGDAYYQLIDDKTKVRGSVCLNSYCHPSSPNPGPKDLPITDSDVQNWKDEITSTGTILEPNSTECPNSYITGTYCVTTNTTLGNTKINGNLYIGRNGLTEYGATLTLTGNIWVTGDIIFDNNVKNGKAKIDPSVGPGSVVIMTDQTVNVENNYNLEGSGDPRSFLLALSTSTNGIATDCAHEPAPAIFASNNSSSIIFAAIHGMLKVKNGGHLNAAAVEKLCLENGSNVVFNPNILSFTVPSGGHDTVGTALGTWQEK